MCWEQEIALMLKELIKRPENEPAVCEKIVSWLEDKAQDEFTKGYVCGARKVVELVDEGN